MQAPTTEALDHDVALPDQSIHATLVSNKHNYDYVFISKIENRENWNDTLELITRSAELYNRYVRA